MADAGIVRPARRPPGWVPRGPAAAAPADLRPGPREDLCHLAGDWRIFQRTDGHRWSLDDLVTAWFAAERAGAPRRVVDLGCGIGSVLLLLAWRFPDASLDGIEAQPLSAALARRSIAWNGVGARCVVHDGDLRDVEALPDGPIDLVTGTPPYLEPGTARTSPRVQKHACNFELRGGIEAYARTAARLLRDDGTFVACEQARQDARACAAIAAAGLALTHVLPVVPRDGKAPLFSVYAARRSSRMPPEPRRLPPLVVRDAAGRRTAAFAALRDAMGMPP